MWLAGDKLFMQKATKLNSLKRYVTKRKSFKIQCCLENLWEGFKVNSYDSFELSLLILEKSRRSLRIKKISAYITKGSGKENSTKMSSKWL